MLQRELLHCARLAKQTPAQYLAQHEQLLLDANASSPIDSSELLLEVNENGKRGTPDRYSGLPVAGAGGVEGPGTLVPVLRECGSGLLPAAGEQAGQVQADLQAAAQAAPRRGCPGRLWWGLLRTQMSPWEDRGISRRGVYLEGVLWRF